MTVRFNVSVEETTARLLEQTGARSPYLNAVTQQRWRAWQQALAWLRDEGWTLGKLRQAMEVLSSTWEQGIGGCDVYQPTRTLRASFPDDELDERVCRALCLLAGEWWAGNGAVRDQLQEAPATPVRKRQQAVTA